MLLTSNELEILIHYYTSYEVHDRYKAPAVKEAITFLVISGVIEPLDPGCLDGHYRVTEKGKVWVRAILNRSIPQPKERPSLPCFVCGKPATNINFELSRFACEDHQEINFQEKPKCWCKYTKIKPDGIYTVVERIGNNFGDMLCPLRFCPQCGRKL